MTTRLALPEELTIYSVTEARTQWLAALDSGKDPLRLDASRLREIDGAGLQLLASLARSLGARGRTLRIEDAPPTLQAACERLGLAALLAGTAEPAEPAESAESAGA